MGIPVYRFGLSGLRACTACRGCAVRVYYAALGSKCRACCLHIKERVAVH